ncbi:hypothetical protein SDC9_193553 [bioreactor metagenome]|uniref:Uncharacterized protein n=1 Tax=bioreactor metagenome TaxID=1076179 RepID=A0A645ICG0_9ZZZZ
MEALQPTNRVLRRWTKVIINDQLISILVLIGHRSKIALHLANNDVFIAEFKKDIPFTIRCIDRVVNIWIRWSHRARAIIGQPEIIHHTASQSKTIGCRLIPQNADILPDTTCFENYSGHVGIGHFVVRSL